MSFHLAYNETNHLPAKDRINHFIRVNQLRTIGLKSMYEEDYFGDYWSRNELRLTLGRHTYLYHINTTLKNLGFSLVENMVSPYKHPLYFFTNDRIFHGTKTTITDPYLIRNLDTLDTEMFRNLSYEGRKIVDNLLGLKLNCNQDQYLETMAPGYGNYCSMKRALNKQPLPFEQYMDEQMPFLRHAELHNKCRYKKDLLNSVSECRFGNRFHSIISCCPGILKRSGLLSFYGEPIFGIDLGMSQALGLDFLLLKYIGKNSFSAAVRANSDIYVFIQHELGLESRAAAKTVFFWMIFGSPYGKGQEQFDNLFPDAAAWVKKLKLKWISGNPSEKIHSNLAWMLQQLESRIFREIWKKLHWQGIKFLPIHDEILCRLRDLSQVTEIMDRILKEKLSDLATIKTNYYGT